MRTYFTYRAVIWFCALYNPLKPVICWHKINSVLSSQI